jgi:hypothetical protein
LCQAVRNKVAEYIMEKLDSCVAIRYSIMQRMADEREVRREKWYRLRRTKKTRWDF